MPRAGAAPVAAAGPQQGGYLDLQATAGNRAVASAIAAADHGTPRTMHAATLLPRPRPRTGTPPGHPQVQRAPITSWMGPETSSDKATDTSSGAPFDPGALVLQPAGGSKPAAQMSYEELGDAIDDIDLEVGEHMATTPDGLRLEARRAELLAARNKLAGQAVHGGPIVPPGKGRKAGKGAAPGGDRKRGKKAEPAAPKVMPPKPDTLRGSLNLAAMKPGAIKAEMDKVVAYLAAGPSKEEREILVMELPNLEAAAGVARQERHAEKRNEKLAEALGPTKGDEADQLTEMLSRIQGARQDPSREHGWLILHDGKAFPLMATELMGLKGQVADGLLKGAAAVNGMMWDVHQAWQDRTDTNRKHNWVHGLVKFATGADDISAAEIKRAVDAGDGFVRNVKMLGQAGLLTDAGRQLLVFDRYTRHMAQKIGEWESELMGGAGRWVLALTIVKEALTIMSGVGAVGLATKAGGGALGMFQAGAEITAMTTATGGVSAYAGAAVAGSDRGAATRLGLGAGFGVGANALTAGASKFAAIGDAAKATGAVAKGLAVGKAVGVDMLANTGVGVTQALIEGGSVKNAIIGGVVSSPINTLGGGLVEAAGMGHLATAGGKALVGTGAGGAGALATGDDARVGMLKGGLGSLYGSASNHLYGPTGLGKDTPIGGAPAPDPGSTPGSAPQALPPGEAAPLMLPAAGETSGGGATPALPAGPEAAAGPAGPAGVPTAADVDAHFAGLTEGDLAGHNPGGTTGYEIPVEAVGGKGGGTAAPVETAAAVGTNEDQLRTAATAGTMEPVGTVGTAGTMGSVAPVKGPAGGRAIPAVDSDLVREPNTPDAVPTGVTYEPRDASRYRDIGPAGGGTSGARVVVDSTSGRKFLFKPVANEREVPRAQDRGIRVGEYAPRNKAAQVASEALGLPTPHVELVQIGSERGSLTDWVQQESLESYIKRDPAGFAELRHEPEFKAAQDAIDTLDFLINNVDRAQNKGNYLIEFGPDGRFKTLTPIDSELSFTSTKERARVGQYANDLPATMSADMAERLGRLSRNREAFVEAIRPLVGEAAIPGVLDRLDTLLTHAERIAPATSRTPVGAGSTR